MRNKIFTIFLAILSTGILSAQDPEMTQYYAAPIYTNPAMAGTGSCNGGGRINLNYRNQWPSLPGTFVTTVASYDQHFDGLGGGIGIIAMNDVAGEGKLTSNSLAGVYSYQLSVNRKFTMRFGLEAQVINRAIDWSKLRFPDQIDATKGFTKATQEPLDYNRITFPNFSTGVLGYTERFYAGVAVHNLIEPIQSFLGTQDSKLPRRYTIHSGLVIPLDNRYDPNMTISPNVLFMLQNKFTQLNLGFYFNKGPLVSGLWYRQTFGTYVNSDALMLLVGFRKERFKFGYSYDLTVSSARQAAPGSHEVSASLEWCASKRPIRYKKLTCPDF
ncbi:MAG: type IX secretion system membrane protein PorP/SprF [Bacteroidetes bacterium]|nr:type IX secretion system membrane protein PorP/SprF [Bacteroidota bacterium]